MTLTFHWFLPTASDGRSTWAAAPAYPRPGRRRLAGPARVPPAAAFRSGHRRSSYLAQVARPPRHLGFEARSPRPAPGARTPG